MSENGFEYIERSLKELRDSYLERLPQVDRENVEKISRAFKDVLKDGEKKGAMLAVGGSINKPFPRKDIDLMIVLENGMNQENDESPYRSAISDFEEYQAIIEDIARRTGMEVEKVIPPSLDREYPGESVLLNDGSVILRTSSTPIEIIRNSRRESYENFLENDARAHVLLEKT